ncbi:MAG: DUF2150 family protein [Haloarculaceae archaeon]
MSTPPGEYYTAERWENWLERLRDEEVDLEEEDSARLLFNMRDDTAIAVAKVLTDYDDGEIDAETARGKLEEIADIVLDEVEFEDEDKQFIVGNAQESLRCVLYAAQEYVAGGPAEEASAVEYVQAAVDAEAEDDLDAALVFSAKAGTRVVEGDDIDVDLPEDAEYGLVGDWVDGLNSLAMALSDPEVVEEDDE